LNAIATAKDESASGSKVHFPYVHDVSKFYRKHHLIFNKLDVKGVYFRRKQLRYPCLLIADNAPHLESITFCDIRPVQRVRKWF
jgi:hypothetical protein